MHLKYRLAIILIWLLLFIFYLTNNYLVVSVPKHPLVAFIDNNIILKYFVMFLSYWLNCIIVFYAIFRIKIFSKHLIQVSLLILSIWSLKLFFQNNTLIMAIFDILFYASLLTLNVKIYRRIMIGCLLNLIFIVLSASIKNIILSDPNVISNSVSLGFIFMFDVYIMCTLYYLREVKR